MEIGIFTFWASDDNYGQALQSYALQYYLNKQKDVHAEVIPFYSKKLSFWIKMGSFFKKYFLLLFPFIDRIKNEEYKSKIERKFRQFKKRNINYLSHVCYGREDLNKYCKKYDILIVGSDQVWSMMLDNKSNSVYYLDFGQKWQKRISYAASFGLHIYPSELIDVLKKQLDRFDFISVREDDAVSICNECGKNAIHVLDPTFLLDKSEYGKFLCRQNYNPYIFLYVLNINSSEDIMWKEVKEALNGKSIKATSGSGYKSTQIQLDGVSYENSTIEAWLSNIAFADTVITTSFHGVVFSIIFEKQFVYIPLKGEYSESNNRVVSLLNLLCLRNRILTSDANIKDLLERKINYEGINQKIEILKNKSIDFLMSSLYSK